MPAVGAVFLGGTDTHTCTGAVVHSESGDLVLTAAHCLAAQYPATFVPGFYGGAMVFAMVGGLCSVAWYMLIARRLFQFGRDI